MEKKKYRLLGFGRDAMGHVPLPIKHAQHEGTSMEVKDGFTLIVDDSGPVRVTVCSVPKECGIAVVEIKE